jgi:hypothetical protein
VLVQGRKRREVLKAKITHCVSLAGGRRARVSLRGGSIEEGIRGHLCILQVVVVHVLG